MTGDVAKGCVCVVDDDTDVRNAIGSLLRACGFEVRLHASPQAFLAAGLPEMPSCLVLDVRLSGASGLEFQEKLNAGEAVLPTILVTGYKDAPMAERAMRAGAVDLLPKPFEEERLLAAIETAITMDQARRSTR